MRYVACAISPPHGRAGAREAYSFQGNQRRSHPLLSLVRRQIASVQPSGEIGYHHEIDQTYWLLSYPFAPCRVRSWAQPGPAAQPPARGGQRTALKVAGASGETKAVTQAILEEIDKRSELMANIEYLCDMIGPRLTGSPNLTRANQWTRDKFKAVWPVERSPRVVDNRTGLDAWRRQGTRGRAGRAAAPGGVGRLEPLDQGPAARPGRSREGAIGR